MNKLIIAGNGFDLAHGLPTSYNHFMDAFWRDLKDDYEDEVVKKVVYLDPIFQDHFKEGEITNFKTFETNIHNYLKKNLRDFEYDLDKYSFSQRGRSQNYDNQTVLFKFKNQFFKELNEIQSIENWVDVENEYYQALKNICKDEKLETRQKRFEVEKLHKEFEQVKQLLECYLQKKVIDVYDFRFINDDNCSEIFESLKPFTGKPKLVDESSTDEEKMKAWYNGCILNFNYTHTSATYIIPLYQKGFYNVDILNIHGKINQGINFGFGDEMDNDYKLIEDMGDNEYLRYFKSFQYLQNSDYKKVSEYLNIDIFQVIIMGHSCGLSDRTLLNTIFEHENCSSIKVFYHKKKDGTDNYTDIIQNISRHFNDKKLMQIKILEKTLCEPMPQIQLPKKG